MKRYDLIFMVDAGIGNAIQALYAVEYALNLKLKVGFYMASINQSFQNFIDKSYPNLVINSLEDIHTKYLIHGFTYQKKGFPEYEHYFYVNADKFSSKFGSETEQFLYIVTGLFPGTKPSYLLKHLNEDFTTRLKTLDISNKYVIYPGGSAVNPTRRWPHYQKLVDRIGVDNCMIVGGSDDINFIFSYKYPKIISKIIHQKILNNKTFWKVCKVLRLLKKHAHLEGLDNKEYAYINTFSWEELIAIFKRCKAFIGNDGGLTHIAAASGAGGVAIFGPTSLKKNKPYNPKMKCIQMKMPCLPCQFGVGKVQMVKEYINCPYQIACLDNIKVDSIMNELELKDI